MFDAEDYMRRASLQGCAKTISKRRCAFRHDCLLLLFVHLFCFSPIVSVLCAEWGHVGKWEHGKAGESMGSLLSFTFLFHFSEGLFFFFILKACSFRRPGCSHYRKCSAMVNVLQFVSSVQASTTRMQYTFLFFSPIFYPCCRCGHITFPAAQETLNVGCMNTASALVFTCTVSHWNLNIYSTDCFCWSAASCRPCPAMAEVQPVRTLSVKVWRGTL